MSRASTNDSSSPCTSLGVERAVQPDARKRVDDLVVRSAWRRTCACCSTSGRSPRDVQPGARHASSSSAVSRSVASIHSVDEVEHHVLRRAHLVHAADDLTDGEARELLVLHRGRSGAPPRRRASPAAASAAGRARRGDPTPRSTPSAAGAPACRSSPGPARCRATWPRAGSPPRAGACRPRRR